MNAVYQKKVAVYLPISLLLVRKTHDNAIIIRRESMSNSNMLAYTFLMIIYKFPWDL